MSRKFIIRLFKVLSLITCTAVGGLAGFLFIGYLGMVAGLCIGVFSGVLLGKQII